MPSRRSILVLATVLAFAACSTAAQPVRPQTADDVVATVGGIRITLADVDGQAMNMPADNFGNLPLSQALYEARRAVLDDMIGTRLIDADAKTRGVEPGAVVLQEITAKVAQPTDAEIENWYKANQQRVQGASLEQVAGPIRSLLLRDRTEAARRAFVDRLKASTPVTITLNPPRLAVSDGGRPAKGPANAPIQMIEFSDFECPFCFRANPTIAQVLSTYGDRIRLVYRHYPLPNHPNARPAAEASACANEQGKFWEFHDRLFANQSRLSLDDLKQHAAALGLDAGKFNTCLDSRRFQKDVEEDLAAGQQVGVSGTPHFFINGRALSGAQPFEAFRELIDDELELLKSR
jgi:protein-disulfide isomerase